MVQDSSLFAVFFLRCNITRLALSLHRLSGLKLRYVSGAAPSLLCYLVFDLLVESTSGHASTVPAHY